jgi:hypothetical protein
VEAILKTVMMIIKNEYNIEDVVYLKTDPDQRMRIVTAIKLTRNGSLTYELSHTTYTSWHYDFEFSRTKDYSISG